MPVKHSDDLRWVEMELVVPGTPDQLWQAVATGPGNAAWFTPTQIDGRVGGTVVFDLGDYGESIAEITVWDPPRRLGYVERDWAGNAPPLTTEISVTGRPDGALLRMRHTLESGSDEWDPHLEGFEAGWPGCFEVLRLYLANFAGLPAVTVGATGAAATAAHAGAWKTLTSLLGLAGADVGDERSLTPGPQTLTGVVERVSQDNKQRYLLLRLTQPGAGAALIGTYDAGERVNANVICCFYGDDAADRAAGVEDSWRDWLSENIGPPPAAPAC